MWEGIQNTGSAAKMWRWENNVTADGPDLSPEPRPFFQVEVEVLRTVENIDQGDFHRPYLGMTR